MNRAVLLLVFSIVLVGSPAAAQVQSFPVVPAASECTVEEPDDATLFELSTAEYVPAGTHESADESPGTDDVNAAIATIVQSVACTNANKQKSGLALFTDRYLTERFSIGNGPDELGHLIAASSRSAEPATADDQLSIDTIGGVELFTDGRIGLNVETSNAHEIYQDVIILAEVDEDWLIDEVVIRDETILKATPEASSRTGQKPVG